MAGRSDRDLVNFQEEYELNYILRRLGKNQSQENRDTLQSLGLLCKEQLGRSASQTITHREFYAFVDPYCLGTLK